MANPNASMIEKDIMTMSNDELLLTWNKTQGIAKTYKEKEAELRKEIVQRIFKEAGPGSTNLNLPKGWILKCVKKVDYVLDQKKTPAIIDEIKKSGNFGEFIVNRLLKPKYDISVTEYKTLSETKEGLEIKAIVDGILTLKDAMPTLELVDPKRKG